MPRMPPPPPKELPKRASPRMTPRPNRDSQTYTTIDVKLAGCADAIARLKFFRETVNEIQSENLRVKSDLVQSSEALKVGPNGGLDVQALAFVTQRGTNIDETCAKQDETHRKMPETAFIAEQRKSARSTAQLQHERQMLERAMPPEQVTQSYRQFGNGQSVPARGSQPATAAAAMGSSGMLNPYSLQRPSNARVAAMRANATANPQPTGLYQTADSPYAGLNEARVRADRYNPAGAQAAAYPTEANLGVYPGIRPPSYNPYGNAAMPQAGMYPNESPYQQNPQGFQAL